MNKSPSSSSSPFDNEQIFIFQKKKKNKSFLNLSKKKKRRKFSKKALGLGALGSYFLGCFQKKKKKNHQSKFSIPLKNSRFPNSSQKKKIQIFNSLKKFKISKFFKKKKRERKKKKFFFQSFQFL